MPDDCSYSHLQSTPLKSTSSGDRISAVTRTGSRWPGQIWGWGPIAPPPPRGYIIFGRKYEHTFRFFVRFPQFFTNNPSLSPAPHNSNSRYPPLVISLYSYVIINPAGHPVHHFCDAAPREHTTIRYARVLYINIIRIYLPGSRK